MTLLHNDLLRTIFRNTFWSTFATIASPILVFLFGGLTIRYVGIEAAGFSMAVGAIVSIAGQFGTLGIADAALPAMAAALGAGDRSRVRRLVGTLLVATLLPACVTAGILVACAAPIAAWTRTNVPLDEATAFARLSAIATIIGSLTAMFMNILRAACRHDLVTKTVLPLSILAGVTGCVLIPLFPSLPTVALINCCFAMVNLLLFFRLARRIVAETTQPEFSLAELPGLARYGSWISATKIVAMMTGGVDDLVLTATCGAAAVPPWAICKKLLLTVHTFLAQHTEHLIPTLGAVRDRSRSVFDSIQSGMHWYVVVVAAAGYAFTAWAGPAVIAMVAGSDVAKVCTVPLVAYSLFGLVMSLTIIPVITGMALSNGRPAFIVALLSCSSQLLAVLLLARTLGVPAAYHAPLFAIPFVLLALGSSSADVYRLALVMERIKPVAVPLTYGVAGVAAAMHFSETLSLTQRASVGAFLAPTTLAGVLVTERLLGINDESHRHLGRVVRHAVGLVGRISAPASRWLPAAMLTKQPENNGREAT